MIANIVVFKDGFPQSEGGYILLIDNGVVMESRMDSSGKLLGVIFENETVASFEIDKSSVIGYAICASTRATVATERNLNYLVDPDMDTVGGITLDNN